MGLSRFLLRVATGHPRVLLIEVPGGTRVRLIAERELRQRRWVAATSPADTDVLMITGPLGRQLQPRVDRVWQQIPGPRVYLHLPESDLESSTVATALDDARSRLATGAEPIPPASSQDPDTAHGSGQRHAPAGHHDMHGGRGNMHADHQGMEMPGGLPMADRGEDRDGLMLDQLHVPLGPLLPDWPAGLVVHTTLQGDVVQAARIEILRADGALDDSGASPGVAHRRVSR